MIQHPKTPRDWERYYDLRWQLLRAPLRQPKGSERDPQDDDAYHVMWCVRQGVPVGIGRLSMSSPGTALIRYVAVLECWQGTGIGAEIMQALESEALRRGAGRILTNARISSVGFYKKLGYVPEGPGPLLFGEIPHLRMCHVLRTSAGGTPQPAAGGASITPLALVPQAAR